MTLKYSNLSFIDPEKIHPHIAPLDDPKAVSEAQNIVQCSDMIEPVRTRSKPLDTLPGCERAVKALEGLRKALYDDWMNLQGLDLLAFPTNGDVSFANADEDLDSMHHAVQDGVKYANGGWALKHLDVPCITVPMGEMEEKGMPVGITLATKGWADQDLLRFAFAYENASKRRTIPRRAPAHHTDKVPLVYRPLTTVRPVLLLDHISSETIKDNGTEIRSVSINGRVASADPCVQVSSLTVFVDGQPSDGLLVKAGIWSFERQLARPKMHDKYPTLEKVPKDNFMPTFVAKTTNGRCAAEILLVE